MGIDILADTYSDVSYRLGDLCGFIQTAVTAGILERDTTRVTMFRPNSPITRGDFADIIVRSYDGAVPGFITIPSEGSRYYTDVVPYTMSNSNITSNLQTSNSSSVSSSNSINRLATTGCLNTNLTTYRSYVSITR